MPGLKRKKTQSTDQVRKVIAAGAGTPIDTGDTEIFGPTATGGGASFGGGYDMLCGEIEADQTFSLTIAQGATFANQNETQVFNSQVDAVSGLNVLPVRWIIGGEYTVLTITNTGGLDMTYYERSLYLMPHGSHIAGLYPSAPLYVQGPDAIGAAPTHNPFGWAGIDAGGILRYGGCVVGGAGYSANGMPIYMNDPTGAASVALPGDAGTTYDYLQTRLTDGDTRLSIAVEDAAAPTDGIMSGVIYRTVKLALDDADAGLVQADAYGNIEPAAYSRPLGADQIVEIAPVQYDIQAEEARADAALTAGNVFDAAATEIPVAGYKFLRIWVTYTRAAAGGGVIVRVESAVTVAGADTWGRDAIRWLAGFVPNADFTTQVQRDQFQYGSIAAGAETFILDYDIQRPHKIRIPCAEVLVGAGNEGDCEVLYLLSN